MRLNSLILMALVSLFFSSLAHAQYISEDECGNFDLSKKMGPVRQQTGTNWCQSFVAAELIGAEMGFSNAAQVSALDVALQTLTADPAKLKSSIDGLESGENKTAFQNLLQELNSQMPEILASGATVEKRATSIALALFTANFNAGVCLESDRPSVKIPDQLKTKSADELMSSCRRHPAPMLLPKTYGFQRSDEDLPLKLNELLNREPGKEKPVGITVAATMMGPDYSDGTDHAMTVVGRRWNGEVGRCEFKIRNSWGPGCEKYQMTPFIGCEDGHVWIDDLTLMDYLHSLTWL